MKIGFAGLLTLIFVVCKLAGVIAWSWWLVFAPALIAVVLGTAITALALTFGIFLTARR